MNEYDESCLELVCNKPNGLILVKYKKPYTLLDFTKFHLHQSQFACRFTDCNVKLRNRYHHVYSSNIEKSSITFASVNFAETRRHYAGNRTERTRISSL